jgi:Ca2+-binding EF-hand superfamily protein
MIDGLRRRMTGNYIHRGMSFFLEGFDQQAYSLLMMSAASTLRIRYTVSTMVLMLSLVMTCQVTARALTNQEREDYQRGLFTLFDKDKNGRLSRQEFVDVVIENLFNDFDKNKDGKISKLEFFNHATNQKEAKQEYPVMDSEGKGYFTLKNVYRNKALIKDLEKEFGRLDRKKKGYVELKDLPDLTPQKK